MNPKLAMVKKVRRDSENRDPETRCPKLATQICFELITAMLSARSAAARLCFSNRERGGFVIPSPFNKMIKDGAGF